MCTVTYLPKGNEDFILTSNRDESPHRKTSAPQFYEESGIKLLYPKDELAGGTWIGISELHRLACLLNGGFEKHQRKSSYRKSRGLILKEILTTPDYEAYITRTDFTDIEPFTIILLGWTGGLKAYELVWDGEQKHFSQLGATPKIWSSSPLYDQQMKSERKTWFQNWLTHQTQFEKQAILDFHHNKDLGTKTTSLIMDRLFVKTVSISSIQKKGNSISFYYKDLSKDKVSETIF